MAYLAWADDRWWMFVANSVAHFLFVPVGLVLLTAVVFRHRGLALVALIPTIIAAASFGASFVPVPVRSWWSSFVDGPSTAMAPQAPADVDAAAARERGITVLTFNIHAENDDLDGVAASILAADTDVVALQEVGEAMGPELRERLRDEYPYASFTFRSGWGGLAVLSRFPISPGSGWFEPITSGNPQVLILATPVGDVDLVHLHNASLPRNVGEWPELIPSAIAEREAVSRSIAAYAQRSRRPLLVVGDFNTTERSTAYAILHEVLRDAWREAGFGLGSTFPGGSRSPTPYDLRLPWWLIRIDYVFHSDAFEATGARIGQWDGQSDHRPVVVELAWRGGG
ncbi:MAG: endonuclease/exonuclease/phosphatase family protein [Trueperaceae bacterium]